LQFASWTLPGSFGQPQILFVHRRRHSVEGVGRRRSFWLAYSKSPHRERPAVWLPSELGKLITTPPFLQKLVCGWFSGLTIVIIKYSLQFLAHSAPQFSVREAVYTFADVNPLAMHSSSVHTNSLHVQLVNDNSSFVH
jgi:hypothetical protein